PERLRASKIATMKTEVACEICGKKMLRSPSRLVLPHIYCSMKCNGIGKVKSDGVNLQLFQSWSPARAYLIGLMASDGCIAGNLYFATFWTCDLELAKTFKRLVGERATIGKRWPQKATKVCYCVSV